MYEVPGMTKDDLTLELRSFGRRRGRKASPRQAALLRDVLPRVAVDLSAPCPAPSGRLPATTWKSPCRAGESEGANEKWLEIGFGGAEHLVWQARHNPAVTLIGCEPFEDGVVKVLDVIDHDKLANIRVHMGDARDVLRWLPDGAIARAFILFPDPWPKRKHQKRRLVNPQTLALLARVLKPGAELRFGTDIGDYARSALEAFASEPRFTWLAERPSDWRIRPADWPETRYEAKAAREGRVRYYFRFQRV
jgi:tRNA (guanine-N7-)-methyltransferase